MDLQRLHTLTGVLDKAMCQRLEEYMDICARCGICRDACHQYASTGDFTYLPARRAELIRQIYKKYFTRTGRFAPGLYEARDPGEDLLDELYESTYACTGCRRCMFYCPFSIDTSWVLSVAKSMLIAAGRGNEMLGQLADAAVFKGKNAEMFADVLRDAYQTLEEEVRQITGDPGAEVPLSKPGADVLYVALAGAHTVKPAAVIFETAGESWTLSMFEAANYGYFYGDVEKARLITERYVDEAVRLGVKEVVLPECGHAYRVARYFYQAWSGRPLPFKVTHILEKVDEYIKAGRIVVRKGLVKGRITYHDPCQIARNGGLFEQPRDVVKALTDDFVELTPNREKQWCCGGGGGIIVIDELNAMRLASGEPKVEQLRASGADVLACPCEQCRLQIGELCETHGLDLEISQVIDLVVAAMPLPGATQGDTEE